MENFTDFILSFPFNTASAERGFSTLNFLKNRLRSQIKDYKFEKFMKIYLVKDLSGILMENEMKIRKILVEFSRKNRDIDFVFI